MTFWSLEAYEHNQPVIFDANNNKFLKRAELQKIIDQIKRFLPTSKSLGFIIGGNNTPFVATYLASLQIDHTAYLLDQSISGEKLERLIEHYHPDWIVMPHNSFSGNFPYQQKLDFYNAALWVRHQYDNNPIFNECALLLATSGSMGSAKSVRLSFENLQKNAESIVVSLGIHSNERPLAHLPLSYSYGLSVLNSHLQTGATIFLTADTIITREFWDLIKNHQVTSLAGVPYTYHVLRKINFHTMDLSSLNVMTQAGGRIQRDDIFYFSDYSEKYNKKFIVMYGQTEATARISYLPPMKLREKIGSIGVPIHGGNLKIINNELIYSGPNVMLGYASNRRELSQKDDLMGVLSTGDLAYQDEEGYFYLSGRLKRISKIYGLRIPLDELEMELSERIGIQTICISDDNRLFVFWETSTNIDEDSISRRLILTLSDVFSFHQKDIIVRGVECFFRTNNGKIDYQRFQALL